MNNPIGILVTLAFAEQLFVINFLLFFKKEKNKLWWLYLVAGLVLSNAVLYLRILLPMETRYLWVASIIYLAVYVIQIIACHFAFRMKIANSISLSSIGYAFQHITYSICSIITGCLHSGSYQTYYYFIELGIFIVSYILIYFLYIKNLPKEAYPITLRRALVSSAILFLVTSVINLYFSTSVTDIWMLVSTKVLAIIACFFVINLQRAFALESEKEAENELLKNIVESEQSHQKMSEESINTINIKVHDLKKLISSISLASDDRSRAEIMKETSKAIQEYSSIAHTQNKTLDNVLFEKNLICQNHGINLVAICDGAKLSFMNNIDLYSLFVNILDNAIEAVLKLKKEERIIRLRVFSKGDFVYIIASNPYLGQIKKSDSGILTSKEDNVNHGFGLKSIKYLVEKYKGNLVVETENDYFSIKILFPLIKEIPFPFTS